MIKNLFRIPNNKNDDLFKFTAIGVNVLWLLLFALIPLSFIFIASFLKTDEHHFFKFQFTLAHYYQIFNPIYFKVFYRSFILSITTTFLCLLIGYPFAYLLARLKNRYKSLLLILTIIPFWTNSLLRSYAIMILLEMHGLINNTLIGLHIITKPIHFLYTNTAVLIGLVYTLLPFMILPLYANIEKLDEQLIDAARDLGANKFRTFHKIILPLTLPGIYNGIILVLLPAMTLFYIPDILGGAKSLLLGNLIQYQFLTMHNWPMGATTSTLLTILMSLILLFYWFARTRFKRQVSQ